MHLLIVVSCSGAGERKACEAGCRVTVDILLLFVHLHLLVQRRSQNLFDRPEETKSEVFSLSSASGLNAEGGLLTGRGGGGHWKVG